jgi:hypothetical protein
MQTEYAEVQLILLAKYTDGFIDKTDEKSKPITLKQRGIKVVSLTNQIATLRMSERAAINYGLV